MNIRQGRAWADGGGYAAQIAKRVQYNQRMYGSHDIVRDLGIPNDAQQSDAEIDATIKRKRDEYYQASDMFMRGGDTLKARYYELRALGIDQSWSEEEIKEYFRILPQLNQPANKEEARLNDPRNHRAYIAVGILLLGMGGFGLAVSPLPVLSLVAVALIVLGALFILPLPGFVWVAPICSGRASSSIFKGFSAMSFIRSRLLRHMARTPCPPSDRNIWYPPTQNPEAPISS